MNIVVDASVVTRFLLGTDTVVFDRFSKLLRDSRDGKENIFASRLLSFEVCNALRFTWKDLVKMELVINKFYKLPIKYLNITASQMKIITKLSLELGTTVYDTSYHVLAKAHGANFLTCDKDYFKKAKEYGDIEYLG